MRPVAGIRAVAGGYEEAEVRREAVVRDGAMRRHLSARGEGAEDHLPGTALRELHGLGEQASHRGRRSRSQGAALGPVPAGTVEHDLPPAAAPDGPSATDQGYGSPQPPLHWHGPSAG